MFFRYFSRLLLITLLAFSVSACKENVKKRIRKGVRYVKSNPDKAITILKGVLDDQPKHFLATYYIGLAYRYKKDNKNTEVWFKKALALKGRRNVKTMRGFLREIYLKNAEEAEEKKDTERQVAELFKAAKLERQIGNTSSASIKANAELFELLDDKVRVLVKANRYQEAIKVAEQIRTLWFDATKLRAYKSKIRIFQREDFRHKWVLAFNKTHRDLLLAAKQLLPAKELLVVTADVPIPAKDKDPRFDPEGDKFMFNVDAITRSQAYIELIKLAFKVGDRKVDKWETRVLLHIAKEQIKDLDKGWVDEEDPTKTTATMPERKTKKKKDTTPEVPRKYRIVVTMPVSSIEEWIYRLSKTTRPRTRPAPKKIAPPKKVAPKDPSKEPKKEGEPKSKTTPEKDDKKKS